MLPINSLLSCFHLKWKLICAKNIRKEYNMCTFIAWKKIFTIAFCSFKIWIHVFSHHLSEVKLQATSSGMLELGLKT
jgi:hypothetical protein